MPLRRRPKETDWQAELRASAALTAPQPVEQAERRFRSSRMLIVALDIVIWLIATAADVSLHLFGHGHVRLKGAVGAVVVVAIQVPLSLVSRRRRQTRELRERQEHELEESMVGRLDLRLEMIAGELRAFLVTPPRHVAYQQWLETTTHLLDRNSQDAAFAWAQLDVDWNSTAALVSTTELDSRRDLLLELYSEVATPEKVATMRSYLPQAPSARAITSS